MELATCESGWVPVHWQYFDFCYQKGEKELLFVEPIFDHLILEQANAEEVANNLRLKENEALLLHGDMDQSERNKVITAFKRKEVNILVATDVAGKHNGIFLN